VLSEVLFKSKNNFLLFKRFTSDYFPVEGVARQEVLEVEGRYTELRGLDMSLSYQKKI